MADIFCLQFTLLFSLAVAHFLPLLCLRHAAEDPAQPHKGQHPSQCCSLILLAFSPCPKDFPAPIFLLKKQVVFITLLIMASFQYLSLFASLQFHSI